MGEERREAFSLDKNVTEVNVIRNLDLALDSTLQLPMSLLNKDVRTVTVTRIQHSVWISLTISQTTSLVLQAPTPTLGTFRTARDLTVIRKLFLEEGREPSKIYTLSLKRFRNLYISVSHYFNFISHISYKSLLNIL